MVKFKRVFLIVLDSVGIGELPDAAQYNDLGAHTLGNIANEIGGLKIPTMGKLGLGNIEPIKGIEKTDHPEAHYTKMNEASVGKDTMTGHWEIMGLHINKPFQTFSEGFPAELIQELEAKTGRKVIGNIPASGTEIIQELGPKHLETGALIVYTSQDSVLQIAAHEEIIPIEEQYRICEIARELTMRAEFMVGRVIARPFIGEPGAFVRTANRHDYAVKPYGKTVMNELKDNAFDCIALGKISDIYDGEGITESKRTIDNDDGMRQIIEMTEQDFTGLCFLNLVDFDSKYGHRRNPEGYGKALETFDDQLPKLLEKLTPSDLLILTADHGNDPTHHGTDHTREYVPLLVYHTGIEKGKELPIRETFADIGATIADNFNIRLPDHGKSYLNEVL